MDKRTDKVVDSATKPTSLHWEVNGQGMDLVLLHGWGMNGAVWHQTAQVLKQHFRVHVVDLPGYGHSAEAPSETLEEMAELVLQQAPKSAIWVGWSLGGLLATHIAHSHAKYVSGLVTVASSPKFAAERPWRGIQPKVLKDFTHQLVDNFQLTVERFMALQAMGSPSARQDVKNLKQAVFSRPSPNQSALLAGLKMLDQVDLRPQLSEISAPILRLYGRLDGLVPVKVASDVNEAIPHSQHFVFSQSSHAPFMTEPELFCQQIVTFGLQTVKNQ
ncbi:pimeloyl-ACP methyl ester esterase BioH [Vibrio sonorensis]|uniref:pimeloyl-ACP methyl ester esterase BioH n=1 Tax=Vibrio sonorensis TaxID=1004316 RepID=UPI0008DAC2CF|nr:pimeloyl-ACP methyl ester esterase BioH [Vibrio sonorensis]